MCRSCGPLALLPARPGPAAGTRFDGSQLHRRPLRPHRRRPETSGADTVISGGRILAMDPAGSRPESVAIENGRIVAVGTVEEVAAHVGPDTETLDLDGRTMLPGLIDPHMHAAMVLMSDWVDISPMTTPNADAVFEALRSAESTATGWVIAKQFDPTITAGSPRLDLDMLDRLAPDRPLLVFESNGHVAYANSAAMSAAGVDRTSPDPPTARYERTADGELTGTASGAKSEPGGPPVDESTRGPPSTMN